MIWNWSELDVKTSFLDGDLEETIYISQPDGFIAIGDKKTMCLLKKSLYGLKRAVQWYIRFHQHIEKVGFHRSKLYGCVYLRKGQAKAYLLLYVDDILKASKENDQIQQIKKAISAKFEMKDL